MKKHKDGKVRVTLDTTRKLHSAKIKIELAQAEVSELGATFNNLIAKALAFVGAPIQTSLICLDCGVVYGRTADGQGRPCPEGCQAEKPVQPVQNATQKRRGLAPAQQPEA